MVSGSGVQMLLFLVLGTVYTGSPAAAASRNTRQASRCTSSQECILLTSCPELLALLNPPTSAGIRRLQRLTCAFDRRNPKVCCDRSTDPGNPDPPVTPAPPVTTVPIVTASPGNSALLPSNCGAIGDRVVGGDELPLQSYQWLALIGFGLRSDPDWGCGGSLISERYVITAAHCHDRRYNGGQNIVRVRLGEHDISTTRDCKQLSTQQICNPPVQDFDPAQIIVHPNWNKRTNYSDDIALIRLDRPARLAQNVAPICLPPSSSFDVRSFLNGRPAEVAGWGQTESRSNSDVKLMAQLPFVPLNECRNTNHLPLLNRGQLCFGGEKGKDSCRGDSGGPLVGTNTDPSASNIFVLLGVVSYGPPLPTCGNENRPAVYTEVSQYRNWIVNNLRP